VACLVSRQQQLLYAAGAHHSQVGVPVVEQPEGARSASLTAAQQQQRRCFELLFSNYQQHAEALQAAGAGAFLAVDRQVQLHALQVPIQHHTPLYVCACVCVLVAVSLLLQCNQLAVMLQAIQHAHFAAGYLLTFGSIAHAGGTLSCAIGEHGLCLQ
jgi:hypothetical protein